MIVLKGLELGVYTPNAVYCTQRNTRALRGKQVGQRYSYLVTSNTGFPFNSKMFIEISNLEGLPPVLTVSGEVDATSAFQLDEAIGEQIQQHDFDVLLDCKDLTYISSAGLGVLLSHLKELEQRGRRMVLFQLNPRVFSIFQALGLDEFLIVRDSLEEAATVVAEKKGNEN